MNETGFGYKKTKHNWITVSTLKHRHFESLIPSWQLKTNTCACRTIKIYNALRTLYAAKMR